MSSVRTDSNYVNQTFRLLSAIGIILIVAGHADMQIFDMGGLFPYYSFHVALFVFISGYFYKESDEGDIAAFLKRKALHLLLPYFVWNMIYGVLAAVLRCGSFIIGGDINFRTLFIEPFLTGHQFLYQFPAWFVPTLFLLEVMNILMRKILSWLKLNNEYFIMAGSLLLGIAVVWLAIGGHVWGMYKLPGKLLFMLPAFELGQLYKKKLEEKDTLPDILYFGILITIQLCVIFGSAGLAYSTVWCAGFANGPLVPFITIATGIAFWLRIARIGVPLLARMKYMNAIGKHTFSIMMHHIMGFMIVKGFFYVLTLFTPWCADFDREAFFGDISYIYLPGGADAAKWIYLAAGIGISLLIQKTVEKVRGINR